MYTVTEDPHPDTEDLETQIRKRLKFGGAITTWVF